jgi:hypothetical protein
VAHSLGYKLFKTDSIEDMPFEQFKVLVHASGKMNKDLEEATSNAVSNSLQSGTKKGTTHRIIEEQ